MMGLSKNAIHKANKDLSLPELKLKILSFYYGEDTVAHLNNNSFEEGKLDSSDLTLAY